MVVQQTEALVVVLAEVDGLNQVPPVVEIPLMQISAKGMMVGEDGEVDLGRRSPLADCHTVITTLPREGATGTGHPGQ